MLHRHLTHQQFTLAAIDNIITHGRRVDWAELRMALHQDPTLTTKVQRICDASIADPFAQCYHFWKHYAQRQAFDNLS